MLRIRPCLSVLFDPFLSLNHLPPDHHRIGSLREQRHQIGTGIAFSTGISRKREKVPAEFKFYRNTSILVTPGMKELVIEDKEEE